MRRGMLGLSAEEGRALGLGSAVCLADSIIACMSLRCCASAAKAAGIGIVHLDAISVS